METVMQINKDVIKQARDQRAWTQQHLAEACGLSLRTIQRAEKTGTASQETLTALASVLELELAQLQLAQPQGQPAQITGKRQWQWQLLAVIASQLIGLLGVYLGRSKLSEAQTDLALATVAITTSLCLLALLVQGGLRGYLGTSTDKTS